MNLYHGLLSLLRYGLDMLQGYTTTDYVYKLI